jgi:hypothetical protein
VPAKKRYEWKRYLVARTRVVIFRSCPRSSRLCIHFPYLIQVNTRSASGALLPESANSGQIDRRVVYCFLIYIILSGENKYLKIIIYHYLVIYFVMFYTYDVSNRPIPRNIADNE